MPILVALIAVIALIYGAVRAFDVLSVHFGSGVAIGAAVLAAAVCWPRWRPGGVAGTRSRRISTTADWTHELKGAWGEVRLSADKRLCNLQVDGAQGAYIFADLQAARAERDGDAWRVALESQRPRAARLAAADERRAAGAPMGADLDPRDRPKAVAARAVCMRQAATRGATRASGSRPRHRPALSSGHPNGEPPKIPRTSRPRPSPRAGARAARPGSNGHHAAAVAIRNVFLRHGPVENHDDGLHARAVARQPVEPDSGVGQRNRRGLNAVVEEWGLLAGQQRVQRVRRQHDDAIRFAPIVRATAEIFEKPLHVRAAIAVRAQHVVMCRSPSSIKGAAKTQNGRRSIDA